jgi:hypothetical protein
VILFTSIENDGGALLDMHKVVIYLTQVAGFSPYRLWSDPLLARHI